MIGRAPGAPGSGARNRPTAGLIQRAQRRPGPPLYPLCLTPGDTASAAPPPRFAGRPRRPAPGPVPAAGRIRPRRRPGLVVEVRQRDARQTLADRLFDVTDAGFLFEI